MNRRIVIVLLMMAFCAGWTGCTPKRVREARQVLTEADSLRLKGVFMTSPEDSLRIAQTVETLHPWRLVYAADYAKACFHYGRTLRAKGHYPEAMQCFLDVIHSRSRDCIIKGRAYSNIADLCQLEGNYDLAYDMHVLSADCFKKGGNIQAYYYAINNMALQRAFQKDKPRTYELLSTIEMECTDSAVLTKIIETKATICRACAEYDSVLFYISQLRTNGFIERAELILSAQAYVRLHNQDSAISYALQVLSSSCSINDSVNMLYILSHDSSIDNDSLLKVTSERADKQRLYTKSQEQLAHAIELMQQYEKSTYKWVYAVGVTIIIIGVAIIIILSLTKKRRAAKQEQLLQRERYVALNEHNIAIQNANMAKDLELQCQHLRNCKNLGAVLQWKEYELFCRTINARLGGFVDKLQKTHPELKEGDVRFCVLILIDIPYQQMADLLNRSVKSMGKRKELIGKKFGVSMKDLRFFLLNIACNAHRNFP